MAKTIVRRFAGVAFVAAVAAGCTSRDGIGALPDASPSPTTPSTTASETPGPVNGRDSFTAVDSVENGETPVVIAGKFVNATTMRLSITSAFTKDGSLPFVGEPTPLTAADVELLDGDDIYNKTRQKVGGCGLFKLAFDEKVIAYQIGEQVFPNPYVSGTLNLPPGTSKGGLTSSERADDGAQYNAWKAPGLGGSSDVCAIAGR